MGMYINVIEGEPIGTSFEEKCRVLKKFGAKSATGNEYEPNLVCVIDNGFFAAAGWAYSKEEWEAFSYPDGRRKQWFTLERVEEYAD